MLRGGPERPSRAAALGRAALVLLPALAALLVAGRDLLGPAGGLALGCPVLPNRVVPLSATLHAGCPLRAFDRIEQIEVAGRARWLEGPSTLREALAEAPSSVPLRVRRAEGPTWVRVPVVDPQEEAPARLAAAALLAASVLATALLVVLRAPSSAAVLPFSLLYTGIAAFLVCAASRSTSQGLALLLVVSSALVPASLVHLALAFPRESAGLRRHPGLAAPAYALALLFVVLGAASFRRLPAVWIFVEQFLASATLVALAVLALGCARALQDERAQGPARAFLLGLTLVLGVPTLLALAAEGTPNEKPLVVLTWAAALSPIPFGYGIARHHLFGIDPRLRRAVAHLLYLSLVTGGTFLTAVGARLLLGFELPLGEPTVLFAAIFALVAAGDGLGSRLRRRISGWIDPEADRWERLASYHGTRLMALRQSEACARIACEALLDGLRPRGVSVFLEQSAGPGLAHAGGPAAPRSRDVARAALRALRQEGELLVGELPAGSAERRELELAGVEAVAALRGAGRALGVLLVSGSARGVTYGRRHVAFLASVAGSTSVALENARLAEELAASRRFAVVGRLRAELAHEIGKPLGSLEVLARSLPEHLGDPLRASQEARAIARIAARLRAIVREVLASAQVRDRERGGDDPLGVADVIDAAIEETAWAHGPERVARRVAPDLPRLGPEAGGLVRALANLLDNALRASAPQGVVELSARALAGGIELEVVDRGCGMSEQARLRAFQPFASSRPEEEGAASPSSGTS